MIHIQKGNSKLGKTMNIALPPGITCAPGIPCYNDGCYARKFYTLRPNVRKAWDENYELMTKDRPAYFDYIRAAVSVSKPDLFRWHVSGDIVHFAYLYDMIEVARKCKDTQFLCFTKRYEILSMLQMDGMPKVPKNLSLVVSAWPGLDIPEPLMKKYPIAYMRDHRKGKVPDPRIPTTVNECNGGCETCGLCWKLKSGESTVFNRH
jgi:hypothetical protein